MTFQAESKTSGGHPLSDFDSHTMNDHFNEVDLSVRQGAVIDRRQRREASLLMEGQICKCVWCEANFV